ncbi:MAG: glycosyltransferase family 2 protein [Gemmatimonadetes bacterium]|nr:glycosyltransferase family 2 protein [Gemmatimonadota bacterium]MDQ3308689.1 glycosyltransferase family 2 protein [Gemmatimonadota bacterium]MDQ3521998.1 glycosyltransferase family 2 protein [Gemmatimonadota bacterium]
MNLPVARASLLPEALRSNFAVVVPAYNEVESVPALFAALRDTFDRHGLDGEVIFVDDGSRDGTYDAASLHGEGIPRLRLLRHRRNLGKTEAMVSAAQVATAEYLILFDADLQHSTEEFPRFLAKLGEGWDIVTGRKRGQYEKRAVSSVYNRLSRTMFDVPVRDLNSMKAFRREILDEIPLRHDWHRFFVVLAHAQGYSVTEIDIDLFPRAAGVSKYSGRGRVLIGVGDLIVVWFYLKFSAKPMQFFGGTGLALITLGVVVGLVAIVLRVGGLMPPFGYRPLLTLVLLLETVGFMLFGFGFIAELIATLRVEVEDLRARLRSR